MVKKNNDDFKNTKKTDKNYIDTNYTDLMKQCYLDYSVSVLVSRAIPDIRDGLKPVQRKILYDMYEMGVLSNKSYKKSARIVGDTMGKYHPHGDSSIYDAMVKMALDFNKTQKLVDGFGNMGSIEGDEPAAMRYTESRLDRYAETVMLDFLKYNTVNFVDNYDGSEREPEVLPSILPNLLINGSTGIGVGGRTEMPSHNLAEVVDAVIYTMQRKKVTIKNLMKYIKGPDFPTGGIITNKSDLEDVYKKGKGKIEMTGVMKEVTKGSKKQLVITEIPQTMIGNGVNRFIEKIKDLVLDKTLSEITNISNHSSGEGIMIVLDLKNNADIDYVKSVIYNKTPFKSTLSVDFLVIENGRPQQKSLTQLINSFIDFQYEIYTKKYNYLLSKSKEKAEIAEGLIKAIDQLDAIIDLIRNSKSTKDAKVALVTGKVDGIEFKLKKNKLAASKFNFTETQADAILKIQLSRLVGLEINTLKSEYSKYKKEMDKYEKLIQNKNELKKDIIKNLRKLKKDYKKPRKTIIKDLVFEEKEKEIEKENLVVLIDENSYIHSISEDLFNKQNGEELSEYKFIIKTNNIDTLLVFTNKNKVHTINVIDVPQGGFKSKGIPVDNISNFKIEKEKILNVCSVDNDADQKLIFLTANGLIKQTNINEFITNRKTISASKINKGDFIVDIKKFNENKNVIITTNDNTALRFDISEIPSYGKNAAGAKGLKLKNKVMATSMQIVDKVNGTFYYQNQNKNATDVKLSKRGLTPSNIK